MNDTIERHYSSEGLIERILAALEEDGIDTQALTPEILAPIDHFHTGGLPATKKLAAMIDISKGMNLLDIGSGVGGPTRYLAATHGCHATGIDLTEVFCRTATALSERCGLAELTAYHHGNALNMPFADASFDIAWAQNVTMNIQDKARFFAEAARVVRPGGKLVMQEMSAGPVGEPYYPLPWAREPSTSFLASPEELARIITAAGFRVIELIDDTASQATPEINTADRQRLSKLGISLLMGDEFPALSANNARSAADGRLARIRLLAER